MSLIASSIMSKKLASGADAIVLDVKTGSGAFMKTLEDSLALAREMVRIGNGAGRNTIAVVSDMDQPLGRAVGNALEVKEAIDTLRGQGPADFVELCMTLGSQMLIAGGRAQEEKQARAMLQEAISKGTALDKLAAFVEAQGGDPAPVYDTGLLPQAAYVEPILSNTEGYIRQIRCDEIGICSLLLGGGRETKDSEIDLAVGLVLTAKVGDYVKQGEPLAYMHFNDPERAEAARDRFYQAYTLGGEKPQAPALIHQVLDRA
ncbi:MAG: pyrimidine-nucleoside phosphorylase, partial [Acetatifactor sp.]|nr:pyrimidine-nucleoside phosphorylase [Acetatifactor sp.]